jgi:hypothetical protein
MRCRVTHYLFLIVSEPHQKQGRCMHVLSNRLSNRKRGIMRQLLEDIRHGLGNPRSQVGTDMVSIIARKNPEGGKR